jgi:hypothetical protein
MSDTCNHCGGVNPSMARFCAHCGLSVSGKPPGGFTSGIKGFFVVLFAIGLVFAAIGTLVCDDARSHQYVTVEVGPRNIDRAYDLADRKARAVYALLEPNDIRVIVSRRGNGRIGIQATAGEALAMDRFVELITRVSREPDGSQAMAQARAAWNSRRTYTLDSDHAEALYGILAWNDVPVLVSRNSSRRITVEATRNDQETIARIVHILGGRD